MTGKDNDDIEEKTSEDGVNLKIPKQALDFVDFYADIIGMDRDALLTEILTERLHEIKEQFKAIPHFKIAELW